MDSMIVMRLVWCITAVLVLLSGQCLASLTNTTIEAGVCVCNTEDAALYTKPGYEHPIKRYMLRYHCVTTTGQTTTIFGEAWYQLQVDSQDLWTSGEYLAYAPTTSGACGVS